MYGLSGRQCMASISSSRRAVSRASGVPVARAEIALPFNLVEAGFTAGAMAAGLIFFAVAMLLFPRAACDKMTGECLAFIHRSGKGVGALNHRSGEELSSVSL